MRTFSLTSLAGACTVLIGEPWLTAVGAAFVGALVVVAYARDRSDDPGVTTEVALWLAYIVGVISAYDLAVAAALSVLITGMLASRTALHSFSRDWLRASEVRGGLLLAGIALLVVPLAPNQPLLGNVLNPQVMVRLVLVLLVIQAMAHVGRRLLSAHNALALSALASGFVSSTATIASLGMELRQGHGTVRSQAGGAVISCVATMVQIFTVAATVRPSWIPALWLPTLAGALVAALWGWLLLRSGAVAAAPSAPAEDSEMFRLRDALLIAALLTGLQVLVYGLTLWLGDAGLMLGTLLAALADVHAATAAVLAMGGLDGEEGQRLRWALSAAVAVHAVSKSVMACVSGGLRYGFAVACGVVAQAVAVLALFLL
ncbi:hypothetical protein SDC9_131175 [bioreactor metagenome]|uniref:Uncharacterized protein n=1 Tax=bioreactor metagenome TaxID=1076179 RepID=A0A645D453_9ZZZZ